MNNKNFYVRLHVEPNMYKRSGAWLFFGAKYKEEDVNFRERTIKNVFATRLNSTGLKMIKNMIDYNEEIDLEYAIGIDHCYIFLIEGKDVIVKDTELEKYKINRQNKSKYYDKNEVFIKFGEICNVFNIRQRREENERKEWMRLCRHVSELGVDTKCLFPQKFFREKGIAVHPKYGYPIWWEKGGKNDGWY